MKTMIKHIKTTFFVILFALLTIESSFAIERVTYLHTDELGSPIAATDSNGNVLWTESYRPYGERLDKNNKDTNETWYTGKQHDADIGLSYYGARWYDPNVGRFTGVDPIGFQEGDLHTFNRYAYANNNPYKYIDPNGQWVEDVFIGIPSIILGSVSLYDNISNDSYGWAALDALGIVVDAVAIALPGIPGGAGLAIKAGREGVELGAKVIAKATDLPVIKPGTKEWKNAVDNLSGLGKEKSNYRTATATDAKALLKEARGNMNRSKNYTNKTYKKGYETHNGQNSRELGAGNDLQHLKWKDGKSGGHIYYGKPN